MILTTVRDGVFGRRVCDASFYHRFTAEPRLLQVCPPSLPSVESSGFLQGIS